jgi:hypothetical protein
MERASAYMGGCLKSGFGEFGVLHGWENGMKISGIYF